MIVIAPWTIYNTTRFVHPILISAQIDPLLASANCDSTYYGDLQGYFDIDVRDGDRQAAKGIDRLPTTSRRKDVVYRRAAEDYIRANLSRLPAVEGVRLLRIVGLYKTSLYVRADCVRRGPAARYWISWAGLYTLLGSSRAAVDRGRGRAAPPRRTRRRVYPLLAPIARRARDRARHLREHALSHDRGAVARGAGRGRDRRRDHAALRTRYASARN